MSHAARSVYAASLYLIALAFGLMLVPNLILSLFGLPSTQEVWIRMLGMMTLFMGVFQYRMARDEIRTLFPLTVILRVSVVVFVSAFILAGLAKPIFILITAVDVVGAAWTWLALNKDRAVPAQI